MAQRNESSGCFGCLGQVGAVFLGLIVLRACGSGGSGKSTSYDWVNPKAGFGRKSDSVVPRAESPVFDSQLRAFQKEHNIPNEDIRSAIRVWSAQNPGKRYWDLFEVQAILRTYQSYRENESKKGKGDG